MCCKARGNHNRAWISELESSLSSKQDDLRNHLGLAAAVGSTGDSELRALHRQVARLHLALHSAKTRERLVTEAAAEIAGLSPRPALHDYGAIVFVTLNAVRSV